MGDKIVVFILFFPSPFVKLSYWRYRDIFYILLFRQKECIHQRFSPRQMNSSCCSITLHHKEHFSIGKYHTYSIEMRMSMVREYLQGNTCQKDFALQRGINFHTFNSWATKYNKIQAKGLSLSVFPPSSMQMLQPQSYMRQ